MPTIAALSTGALLFTGYRGIHFIKLIHRREGERLELLANSAEPVRWQCHCGTTTAKTI